MKKYLNWNPYCLLISTFLHYSYCLSFSNDFFKFEKSWFSKLFRQTANIHKIFGFGQRAFPFCKLSLIIYSFKSVSSNKISFIDPEQFVQFFQKYDIYLRAPIIENDKQEACFIQINRIYLYKKSNNSIGGHALYMTERWHTRTMKMKVTRRSLLIQLGIIFH